MNIERVLQEIDAKLVTREEKSLSRPEIAILRGTQKGMNYQQIAEESSFAFNYLQGDIGPNLWRRLTKVFGQPINKRNFATTFSGDRHSVSHFNTSAAELVSRRKIREQQHISNISETKQLFYSGEELPKLSPLCDRERELTTLKQWILEDNCRFISVTGMAGIGKTSLVRQLVEIVKPEFEIIWQTVNEPLSLNDLLSNIFAFTSAASPDYSTIVDYLTKNRCLIIFDGMQIIPSQPETQLVGDSCEEFLQLFVQQNHRSCSIVTSRVALPEISSWHPQVRLLTLSGLSVTAAKRILEAENLIFQLESWQQLIAAYGGNPLALKIASRYIRNLFNSNVADFLAANTLLLDEINQILAQQCTELTKLERELLERLAIQDGAVNFTTLEKIVPVVFKNYLIAALDSLEGRSLLTIDRGLYALSPLVKDYIIRGLVENITGENQENIEYTQVTTEEIIDLGSIPNEQAKTHLSQWFEDKVVPVWQPIKAMFQTTPQIIVTRLRGISTKQGIKRFKQIEFEKSSATEIVSLLVELHQETEDKMRIRIQVWPAKDRSLLPQNLRLSLLDDRQGILRTVSSQVNDSFIQLPLFRGNFGEYFSISLQLDNALEHIEEFII